MVAGSERHQFTVKSTVPEGVETVWAYVTTPEGFLNELGPNLHMTIPSGFDTGQIDAVGAGDFMGVSRVLLWNLIPIERSKITVMDIAPPHHIRELHQMILFAEWWQERRLIPVEDGTRIVDDISFDLRPGLARVPFLGALAERFWKNHISARHRRLAAHYASQLGTEVTR